MKDIKVQTVRPVADPRGTEKTAGKEKTAATAFDDTLQNTIERVNDLKIQADAALKAKETSIKEEIDTARKIYDKMMLEKKNLAQLYHRLKNLDES
ncbi:MAG: hypothetical protein V3S29_06325 [bacterium]